MRARFLALNPTCAVCGEVADEVDHIIAHKGDRELFYDPENWQPLCRAHHIAKTRAERKMPRL